MFMLMMSLGLVMRMTAEQLAEMDCIERDAFVFFLSI